MSASDEDGPFIDMALRRIVLRDHHDIQMIYLVEAGGDRSFAISIGRGEAEEMRRVVAREKTARPLTHQLLLDSVRAAGGELLQVEINDLRHNTFYARLVLRTNDSSEERRVDARSSDAIALALRADCPIRVSETVLQQVRIDLSPDILPPPQGGQAGPQGNDDEDQEADDDDDDLGTDPDPDPDGGENLEEGRAGDEDAQ